MNRTIKEATVERYRHDDNRQLETRRSDFIAAYDDARPPKALRGVTPYDFICKA